MAIPARFEVPAGTIHHLHTKAIDRGLPHRAHGLTSWLSRGKTAVIVRQRRTTYGGDFLVYIPVTGNHPDDDGMTQKLWLSVHADDLPHLKRHTKRIQ